MKIELHEVTKLSQIVAIILFVIVFFVAFFIGRTYENKYVLGESINKAVFACENDKKINTTFYQNFVKIKISGWGTAYLPQTISASGARYANSDESIVFWNKGDTAFISEGDINNITFKNCTVSDISK